MLLTATAPPAGGAGRAWPANSLTFVNQSRPPQFVQQRPLGEGIRVATRGRPRLLMVNAVGGAAAGVNGGVAYMGGRPSQQQQQQPVLIPQRQQLQQHTIMVRGGREFG